jgi:hypothetical protein
MARKRILKQYGLEDEAVGNSGFADPAALFKQ